ncbi:MAG: manganese efflux pump [Bacteroidia bacterium]|nr:manganese efflux pump [Bacteroidia bacterium]
MTYIEILILAISLSADTLAVSLSGGMSLKNISKGKEAKIIASFAFFQAFFLISGLLIGDFSVYFLYKWNHWISIAILVYLGVKMISSAFSKSSEHTNIDLLSTKTLILMSVATSIDAIAVGFSIAVFNFSAAKFIYIFLVTFIVTAIAAKIGINSGYAIAKRIGCKAECFGGIVLLIIAIHIFAERIFFY